MTNTIRNIAVVSVFFWVFFLICYALSIEMYWILLLMAAALLIGYVTFRYFKTSVINSAIEPTTSLMALIADYRRYTSEVVHRLEQGALRKKEGNQGQRQRWRRLTSVFAFYELDKIIGSDDIRNFLRRMK